MGKLKGVEKLSVLVEFGMFGFRLFFYLFAIIDFYLELESIDHFFLTLIWLLAAMVVPICFWIPLVVKRGMYFCYAELLLSGSLTIYVVQYSDTYTALFIISALTIAFHLEKRHYWLLLLIAFFPFLEFFIKGLVLNARSIFLYF